MVISKFRFRLFLAGLFNTVCVLISKAIEYENSKQLFSISIFAFFPICLVSDYMTDDDQDPIFKDTDAEINVREGSMAVLPCAVQWLGSKQVKITF